MTTAFSAFVEPAIVRALRAIRPGAEYTLQGEDYDGLIWLDKIQPQPRREEIAAAVAQLGDPVPEEISDRQFFQQLALMQVITQPEAIAAVKTGDIPAALQTFINTLPSDQQFAATMAVSGAVVFHRDHPLTKMLAAGMGWTAQQVDNLWRAASEL